LQIVWIAGISGGRAPDGAYSHTSRGGDAGRRTLKTGYCDQI